MFKWSIVLLLALGFYILSFLLALGDAISGGFSDASMIVINPLYFFANQTEFYENFPILREGSFLILAIDILRVLCIAIVFAGIIPMFRHTKLLISSMIFLLLFYSISIGALQQREYFRKRYLLNKVIAEGQEILPCGSSGYRACVVNFARSEPDARSSLETCFHLRSKTSNRNFCVSSIAAKYKDISLCEQIDQIPDPEFVTRELCKEHVKKLILLDTPKAGDFDLCPGYGKPNHEKCLEETKKSSQEESQNVPPPAKKFSQESNKNVPSPVSSTCPKNFTMAFVLLENPDKQHTQLHIDKLKTVQEKAAERFSVITKGLATLDTSYPAVVLRFDDAPKESTAAQKFIEEHGDQFDFITFFTTYETFPVQALVGSATMYHLKAQNNVEGIGLGMGIFDHSRKYGSEGKLLGINWMGRLQIEDMWDADESFAVSNILHETAHQWGVYVDYLDENKQLSAALRNGAHWSQTLDTGGHSMMHGLTWQDNGNGTFTALDSEGLHGYADIDLYIMGVLPKEQVAPLELIFPDEEDVYIEPGSIIRGQKKTITIDQIVAAMGERRCVTPKHM